MRVVALAPAGDHWQLRELSADGHPVGPVRTVPDPAGEVAAVEAGGDVRWLWESTATCYPPLLRAGVRVARCHDLMLAEGLLLAHAGRYGEPRSAAAVLARRDGRPVPPDPPAGAVSQPHQPGLFDPVVASDLDTLVGAYRDQLARLAATSHPARFRLLVAAESAGALAAAEMGADGLPWRVDVHDTLLTELLGPRPAGGGPPARLVELATSIAEALGVPGLHPESPQELRRAFARAGHPVPDTRSWTLRQVDHPAVPLVLRFKELYRLWTAHGWTWRQTWVRDGRFHPEYVPAGVLTGRWATRGGGALQIPKVVRRAVVADEGWRLVVADAGQLEPRLLAAVSGDFGLTEAARTGDLYAALAAESFGGDRDRAKVALLGAMYGQTGGAAAPALAVLRQRYPVAWRYLEQAARVGEEGGLVRSWLGRTCPPPSGAWRAEAGADDPGADWDGPVTTVGADETAPARSGVAPGAVARARGRFTRNFVIQATAAEWALTMLALVRADLWGQAAHLVFFQHDEILVHCPEPETAHVSEVVTAAAERAGRLLFGDDCRVRFPLSVSVVESYADA